ncbi:MAG: dihydrodipicolinate synthase family protein [Hyphomicrobiaceae bacterium]
MTELRGICTPICTVFAENNGAVDDNRYRRHLDTLLEAGVHIIAPGGGTGEFSFLSPDERRHVLEVAAKHIDGRAKIIAHVSAVMTEETIELAKHAEATGADALLVLPPYFEGPNMAGVMEHYERVAGAVNTPIMAYNIPVHTGIDLDPEICTRLMEMPNIRYLKDSTGDFVRAQDLVQKGVRLFVGGEPIMCHGLLAGAHGCFWGTSNAIPREAVALYDLVTESKFEQAAELWNRIYPLNRFVWGNPFNPGVKAGTNLRGGDVGVCRRPVQPLTAEEHAELEAIITRLDH